MYIIYLYYVYIHLDDADFILGYTPENDRSLDPQAHAVGTYGLYRRTCKGLRKELRLLSNFDIRFY